MSKKIFKLHSPYVPAGSQPEAIKLLSSSRPGQSVLLGVTGSGKTFTLAHTIAHQEKPVLILSPNKTLAAQLYEEFSLFFPENKVCYFVSYYDYYQPESYLPSQDIYIPKETKINPELDRLRIDATAAIIGRPDTIVIASVSAIYSLGNPQDYRELTLCLEKGSKKTRKELISDLIKIQYKRNEVEKTSGTFQVAGGTITLYLPYHRDNLRIEIEDDVITVLELVDRQQKKITQFLDIFYVFPAKHFVMPVEKKEQALFQISNDLSQALEQMENPLYKERLKTRVMHDLDMLKETGYCSGIENYSRYFDGRKEGEAPFALLDFFPQDFLLIIDESHIALPQLGAMYNGDRSRKKSLVEFGFRLPSAFDNRPLRFDEIERFFKDVIFVSATPGPYEMMHHTALAEQIVRPTGIIDPPVSVMPREGQLDHLRAQISLAKEAGFRTLVTVLTKRAAEDLALYLEERKVKVCYLHSDIKTPERTELLQKLRLGVFDCLVGINLLREGLDLPEVALVAIMDADCEGFLRDARSLIQTIGRAARNAQSKVILYADKITKSMHQAIQETERRRTLQTAYNDVHQITPRSVTREVTKSIIQQQIAQASKGKKKKEKNIPVQELDKLISKLKQEMQQAAEDLDFEKAIAARDKMLELQSQLEKASKR